MAETAHETSRMPEICGILCPQQRLCEGSCTKSREPGEAVTIGEIERFLADKALKNSWMPGTAKRNSKQIAVIGAGPAGLACTDELSGACCGVTVYDREKQIGGLLFT